VSLTTILVAGAVTPVAPSTDRRSALLTAMTGHVVAGGETIGLFAAPPSAK
jgi:hypothetical protein